MTNKEMFKLGFIGYFGFLVASFAYKTIIALLLFGIASILELFVK